MKTTYYLIILFSILFSCKPNIENKEIKSRYDQVMMIHDEVMPKMGPMNLLKKDLKKELKNRINNAELSMKITQAISDIEAADDQMMDWMAAFKLPKDKSLNEQKAYLLEEQKRVEKVRFDMEQAMNNASLIFKGN